MSSTNVHSEQKRANLQCVGGQVIPNPKENEMVVPPASAGKSPASLDVKSGDGMEILATESELHKDGKLTTKDGMEVARFGIDAYKAIAVKHSRKATETTRKSKKAESKDEGR